MRMHTISNRVGIKVLWSALLLCAMLLLSSAVRAQPAPSVSITAPPAGAVVNDLRRIYGSFERGSGTSAIVRIEVLWKRAADSLIWNGSSWGRALSWQPAGVSFSTRRFSASSGPGTRDLRDGVYYLYAAGVGSNGRRVLSGITVRVDVSGPSVAFQSPQDGQSVLSLSRIVGTAYDKAGVSRVLVGIRRERDARFWNGSSWVAAITLRAASLSGEFVRDTTREWVMNDGPPASQMEPGQYALLAYARDGVGNETAAFAVVTVPQPAPEPTATPTATATPEPTPTATPTAMPTATPTPTPTPLPSRIVFSSNRDHINDFTPAGARKLDIYSMNPDGSDVRRLTFAGTGTHESNEEPALSFDRSRIVFVQEMGFQTQLWLMDFDGRNQRQLTFDTTLKHRVPCWSPTGAQIAFGGSDENDNSAGGIFIYGLLDRSVRQLTIRGSNPSWGSNNRIVFDAIDPQAVGFNQRPAVQRQENRLRPNFVVSGGGDIYVINPHTDASGLTRLTRLTQMGVAQQPSWSPDASRIAFSRTSRFGLSDDGLFTMNADGSEQRRLIDYAHSPVFSPDGQQVAFDRGQIQKISIDGSGFTILTNPEGQNISDEDPDWR